jgi:hypothetical protein
VVLSYEDNRTDNRTCPFRTAVADQGDLLLLRQARDTQCQTLAGRGLTALFYAFAAETAGIVGRSPELRQALTGLVAQNRPLLRSLAQGEPVHITSGMREDIASVLERVAAGGGLRLGLCCRLLRNGLEQGWLLRILNGTVD